MRRRTVLAAVGLTGVFAPALVVFPVVTAPAATPHAVAPKVQTIPLTGVDPSMRTGGSKARAASVYAVSTDERTADGFRLAGLTWTGADPTLAQIRTRSDGTWSAWQTLAVQDIAPDPGTAEARTVRRASEPLLTPGSDGYQVRVATATGRAPTDLKLGLVDPGTSASDGNLPAHVAASASAATTQPPIVTRAQWGADESLRDAAFKYTTTVKAAVIHHTASSNAYWQSGGTDAQQAAAAAQDIRSIYAYEIKSAGYGDMPYNFLVDQGGRIYEGRAGGVDKAILSGATGGFNTDTMSVAALGNFDTDQPSQKLLFGIQHLVGWKLGLFHVDPTATTVLTSAGTGSIFPLNKQVTLPTVFAHRDVGATLCPGQYLYPKLADIRTSARQAQGAQFFEPSVSPSSIQQAQPVTVTTATSAPMRWQLLVMDSAGDAVRTHGVTPSAGPLKIVWDGPTDAGVPVPVGVYSVGLTGSSGPDVPRIRDSAFSWTGSVTVTAADVPATVPLPSVYWVAGSHSSGGRDWRTTCALVSSVLRRCRVEIFATTYVRSGLTYRSVPTWVFNNWTDIAYDAPARSTTVTALPGSHLSAGHSWRTVCKPSTASGPRTCDSSILTTVIVRTPHGFGAVPAWTLNTITYLALHP
jgi:N-acetylmuramoyl-L-alanine amidase/FlgD Ig-like domain